MKENDEGVLELDESNLDEFNYRYFDITYRGWVWRTRMKLKWKLEALVERMQSSEETMKFLHMDLRTLRYLRFKKRAPTRLRFFNRDGVLKEGRFIISYRRGHYFIKEAKFPAIRDGKAPKGPITVKTAACHSRRVSLTGFTRTWEIPYGLTL